MEPITSLDDIQLLRESYEVECKLAAGRDGQGALPDDFWPTYSAFANTAGGIILLGIKEKNGKFTVNGIPNASKLITDIVNTANNKSKVSANLIFNDGINVLCIDGKNLVSVTIPRAKRTLRPVYLTKNPFDGNSYIRRHEADCRLDDESVRWMIADQNDEGRDGRVLEGFTIHDLHMDTLRSYRQTHANLNPEHVWNTLTDSEFLRNIGGWRKNRESGGSGLTLAGLLMFGTMASIQEELPNYMLDYQERSEPKTELRWIDRITLDGRWSGNLYDFYRKVYAKLTADLKIPFTLKKGERVDDTSVHVVLREALVNAIVHADYSERASLLVVKRPDMFGFRNPGLMRIPVEAAVKGGDSDCRNRILHKMFRLVGAGEQAGTGVPKIMHGWESQHWQPPKLYESTTPFNQTLLELRMVDLFPQEVMAWLRGKFGDKIQSLNKIELTAIALAASEKTVSHERLKTMTPEDPVFISRALRHLTAEEFLESSGGGRGAVYHIFGEPVVTPEDVFNLISLPNEVSSSPNAMSSPPNKPSSLPNAVSSPPNRLSSSLTDVDYVTGKSKNRIHNVSSERRDDNGYLLSDQLPYPCIDNLESLADEVSLELAEITHAPKTHKRLKVEMMRNIILQICDKRFVKLSCIATLVNRKPDKLRSNYLSKMVKEGKLALAFPSNPTHKDQAYCSAGERKK